MIAPLLLSLALLAPAHAGAGAARPPVSLTASPSRVELAAGGSETIELLNTGSVALDVRAVAEGISLDLSGRPTLRPRATRNAAGWLVAAPRSVRVAAGARAQVRVRVTVPPRAEPGDHHAALLFTTQPVGRAGVGVRMRIGVRVVVRAPGTVVRRLRVASLRVRRTTRPRALVVTLANGGNVTEELPRGRAVVTVLQRGRVMARLRLPRRELLPATRGVVSVPYAAGLRGAVVARAEVRDGPRRSFRVRL